MVLRTVYAWIPLSGKAAKGISQIFPRTPLKRPRRGDCGPPLEYPPREQRTGVCLSPQPCPVGVLRGRKDRNTVQGSGSEYEGRDHAAYPTPEIDVCTVVWAPVKRGFLGGARL